MSKIMLDIGMASESSNSVTDSLNEALHVLKNAGLVTDWRWVKDEVENWKDVQDG